MNKKGRSSVSQFGHRLPAVRTESSGITESIVRQLKHRRFTMDIQVKLLKGYFLKCN